ncbi:GNAT family N-acetyltransferase [Oceanospirillum sediminis]|uniref:GNAT family N-acetyltransferase n=1 Tax=Oceanospirillum sediminis TaxID=2760088 RepID=A0A839IVM8_9GAMM|nr:GNAT family N-acetyltransferase [Oceanospirillum sediminis]MBB1489031.1 GNAT family N-acetyltransferase [Oceanospirillum sediminis]
MIVREMEAKDLPECAEVFQQTFSSPPWNEAWSLSDSTRRLDYFFNSQAASGYIAISNANQQISDTDRIIGFILGQAEPFQNSDLFHIREFCVLPEYQNQGAGHILLKTLEGSLKPASISAIYLLTDKKLPAAGFYQNNGYGQNNNLTLYSKSQISGK